MTDRRSAEALNGINPASAMADVSGMRAAIEVQRPVMPPEAVAGTAMANWAANAGDRQHRGRKLGGHAGGRQHRGRELAGVAPKLPMNLGGISQTGGA